MRRSSAFKDIENMVSQISKEDYEISIVCNWPVYGKGLAVTDVTNDTIGNDQVVSIEISYSTSQSPRMWW